MHNRKVCKSDSTYIRLDQVSQVFIDAIVISEDAGFFYHKGFDWFEIKESFKKNLAKMRFARGGSTITQQLAKNIYLSQEKAILRKFREAFLAAEIEEKYSKKLILEKYLNIIEFGPDIFGISQATDYYFDKDPSQLNVLESVFLAFLVPNPKLYHSSFEELELSDFARERVLDLCYKLNFYKKISEEKYQYCQDYVDDFPWGDLSNFENFKQLENEGDIEEEFY